MYYELNPASHAHWEADISSTHNSAWLRQLKSWKWKMLAPVADAISCSHMRMSFRISTGVGTSERWTLFCETVVSRADFGCACVSFTGRCRQVLWYRVLSWLWFLVLTCFLNKADRDSYIITKPHVRAASYLDGDYEVSPGMWCWALS
jgi:hypothetical protein